MPVEKRRSFFDIRDARSIRSPYKCVLLTIAMRVDARKGYAYPGIRRIAFESGYSVSTVKRSINHLKSVGLLRVATTSGTSSKYYIQWSRLDRLEARWPAKHGGHSDPSPDENDGEGTGGGSDRHETETAAPPNKSRNTNKHHGHEAALRELERLNREHGIDAEMAFAEVLREKGYREMADLLASGGEPGFRLFHDPKECPKAGYHGFFLVWYLDYIGKSRTLFSACKTLGFDKDRMKSAIGLQRYRERDESKLIVPVPLSVLREAMHSQ